MYTLTHPNFHRGKWLSHSLSINRLVIFIFFIFAFDHLDWVFNIFIDDIHFLDYKQTPFTIFVENINNDWHQPDKREECTVTANAFEAPTSIWSRFNIFFFLSYMLCSCIKESSKKKAYYVTLRVTEYIFEYNYISDEWKSVHRWINTNRLAFFLCSIQTVYKTIVLRAFDMFMSKQYDEIDLFWIS